MKLNLRSTRLVDVLSLPSMVSRPELSHILQPLRHRFGLLRLAPAP